LVRGCIFEVFNELGPGLLESAYQAALEHELTNKSLKFKADVPLPMFYKEVQIDRGYRLDLLVEEKVIVEIKSIENLAPVYHSQLLTYLRLSGVKLGLLVNFNTSRIDQSIFRKVNGL
jgi:GxxExxY protein